MNSLNALSAAHARELAPHQIKLIRSTIAKDCTELEFDLFMEVSRLRGLNPFAKQVSPIIFNRTDEAKRRMEIVARIDGLRVIAARRGDYRPSEDGALIEIDAAAKDPATNPLGIVRAEVKLWKFSHSSWHPVVGEAWWDEYAPIRDEAEGGYDWVDTGEVWADSGKPKKRRVPRGELRRVLDPNTKWPVMGRVMITKCAEAIALRRGWPEDFSGLYAEEEMDRARMLDATASEVMAEFEEVERLKRVGVAGQTLFLSFAPEAPIETVARGAVADRLFAFLRDAEAGAIEQFLARNKAALQTFWAWDKAEALAVKQFAEQRISAQSEAAP